MEKLLLFLIIPILSFGQCEDVSVFSDGLGGWPEEVSWSISNCDGEVVVEGFSPFEDCVDLPDVFTIEMFDSWGDGWNGNTLIIGDAVYTLDSGSEGVNNVGCDIEEVDGCEEGYIEDCNGNCYPSNWVGDGVCDNGFDVPSNFLCEEFNWDNNDCGDGPCGEGYIEDCNGNCFPSNWVGDAVCDNGVDVSSNFLCAEFNWDNNDCGFVSCGEDSIEDCNGNCVSIEYIGDGDCNDSPAINFDCPNLSYDGSDCVNMIQDCDGNLYPESLLDLLGNGHCNNSIFTGGVGFLSFYNFDCVEFNFDEGDCNVLACTDSSALNYYEHANIDDGSCIYECNENVNCEINYPSILKENIELPSNGPRGLCVLPDSSTIYIGTNTGVVVVDLESDDVEPYLIPTNDLMYSCASSLDGSYVFVANWTQGKVEIIETSSNTIINSIDTGEGTLKIKTSNNGEWIAASNHNNNSVSIIDSENFELITNISVGLNPRNIDFSPNDEFLYVANWGSATLGVYSTSTWGLVAEVSVDYFPQAVCALPGNDYVLVGNFGFDLSYDHLSVIRTSDWQVIARLQTGAGPEDIGLLGDNGEYIYVSNWGNACCFYTTQDVCCSSEIDKGTLTIISTPDFDSIAPPGDIIDEVPYIQSTVSIVNLEGEYSFGIGVNPSFSEVYVANKSSNTVSVVGFDDSILGCTDNTACNFDSSANLDNDSCTYAEDGYDCYGNALVSTQSIFLQAGWNIWSTYISPSNVNISDVFSGIVDQVVIVKNQYGAVYWPEFNLNSVGDLTEGWGYQVKMISDATLEVSGSIVPPDLSMSLNDGWGMLGYLHQDCQNTIDMMTGLTNLIILKDEYGNVYWPEFALNSIGNMCPGEGYQVKTENDIIFSYPALESGRFGFNDYPDFVSLKYQKPLNSGNNMTIAIPDDVWLDKPSLGDEVVAISNEGLVVGNNKYREEGTVLTIWGDDELTEKKDGLYIGEKCTVKLLRIDSNTEEHVDILSWKEGSGYYSVNGISIAGTVFQNIVQEKQLIKITDILGRDVNIDSKKTTLLYIYDDGSIEKKYILK